MSETFPAVLRRPNPRDDEPVRVRLEREEVWIDDAAGNQMMRLPVSRMTKLIVDKSPQNRRRRLVYGGLTVTMEQDGADPVTLRASSDGHLREVWRGIRGDADAAATVVAGPLAYRDFVVELAGALRRRRVPIIASQNGLQDSLFAALLIGLVGVGLIGWQIYQPVNFMFYVVGPVLILGALNMIQRQPGARPREVDGSPESLAPYLPQL